MNTSNTMRATHNLLAVSCHQLCKSFGAFTAVQDVSFSVSAGRILALLGPSGCGKTTTLRLIAGFERLDNGRIEVADQVMDNGRYTVAPEKRRVGMVFQDYAIFPHLSVAENVAFGLNGNWQAAQSRVHEMLAFVDMAGAGGRMPHELSGGQQQRVALARALAPKPVILLLDEPFSNLDATLRVEVRAEVRQLLKCSDVTAVFVTHDQEEALFMGDEVAVMNAGRLEQVGPPEVIFHCPQTRFVAEFLGQTDFIPGQVAENGLITPLGWLPQIIALPPATRVEMVVRPDDVALQADEQGNGRILDRQFVGIAYVYRIGLDNGCVIHSWQPHTINLAVGTAVQATLRGDHSLICFYNGTAV